YLNVIEMGDGVYGAQAASKTFYNKDAKYISKSEAATIAAVLPNPIRFNAGKPSSYIQGRRSWIMNQMNMWGGILNYKEQADVVAKRKENR
ncbi:MAG: transglycosylase domain-containing protein, partial [Bacteroidetes bacterium]|nr:transglycosylase domain-containing protein [Bacteroidota bacterium]